MFSVTVETRALNGYTFSADNSVKICFCFPSEKWSTLKGKNLLPWGSKFFPFRVDHFLGGGPFLVRSKANRKS